jgi:peptidyl-prolyl cis-trans isomerase D
MLQSMRQMAHSWVVKGLLLLLILSFGVWGIGDMFRGNPMQKTVAKAGKTDISVEQLNHLFEQSLAQAKRSIDPNITAQQARQMGLLDKTLDNAIKRDLVDQDIATLGIDVSPQAVLTMLGNQPQFRNKDGSFNKVLFKQLLQQQGLNEHSFLAQGQQDLSRQVLIAALSGSHDVPRTEIDALYKARAQKRVLDVVTVDAAKLGGVPAPDDKALHDFYMANPNLFSSPEYRGITVASLSTDVMGKDIQISDEDVKKEYDAKLDQLSKPEQRDIIQVVVQDQDKAKQLVTAARASGNLTDAAKQAKETAIPLEGMTEKNLLPELAKSVFALKNDEISEPVKTQLGWHVVQLKKITPAGTPTFDKVKAELRDNMRRDQAIEAVTRAVNQLDDQLAAGHSLDDIADELKLRLVKIPAVDATGLMQDGKAPAELPNKDQMLRDAFAQNAGDTSPVEDDKTGNYYVVRTDAVTPSGAKPFESVKNEIAAAWKAQEQRKLAVAEGKKIEQALRDGKPADSLADGGAVTVRVSTPLSQLGDSDPLLPPDILSQASKLKKGATASGVTGNNLVIVRLNKTIDADTAKDDPRKSMVEGSIKQASVDEILDQYIAHLYDVFPVKKDQAVLDHLRQQGD